VKNNAGTMLPNLPASKILFVTDNNNSIISYNCYPIKGNILDANKFQNQFSGGTESCHLQVF